jgi:hypothetical protein
VQWVSKESKERGATYIDLAHGQLEGAEGEEVRGLVPRYVVEGIKMI